VGLERSPLSLVSTIKELLESKSSGSGLESGDYGRRGSAELTTRQPLYPQKFAITSLTSGRRSVGVVRSRTKATELFIIIIIIDLHETWLCRLVNNVCKGEI
jgi:hypothetical protein